MSSVITDRLKRKKITWANYSDIVRNALLSKYGGIWLDATVWVPDKIPFDKLYDLNFYTANSKLPIANRSICFWSSLKWNWSSWCLYTNIENHLIFSFVGEMLQTTALREKYWPDYVIQDYFIYLACRIFPQVTMEMEKAQKWECNGRGEFATLMNRPYDQDAYYRLIKKSFVFKLSFRSKWITETVDGKQTFYGWVLSHQ